jgi:hypothetical protein
MKLQTKNIYKLEPPLKVKCMDCKNELTVLFCPPRQGHSNKNNWYWWSGKKEFKGEYKCDNCIVDMYNNRKFEYLSEITDSKKRSLLRSYLYNNIVAK